MAFPTYGAYAASKFALEAVSDVLRREVGRYDEQVIVIQPGTVATPMWGKGLTSIQQVTVGSTDAQKARYGDLLAEMSKQAETNARNGNAVEPTKVAQVIADAFPNRAPVIWLVATPSFWPHGEPAVRPKPRSPDRQEPRHSRIQYQADLGAR